MNNRLPRRIALAAITAALAGCAVGPDFKAPAAPATDRYTPAPLTPDTATAPGPDGASQHFDVGADIPLEWWTLFHSEEINQLVRTALAHSPTLGAAQATLRQARETLRAEFGALLLPDTNAQLQGARERVSGISLGAPNASSELTVVQATLNATYNVDVFGGARRALEGYSAQVDIANDELEAAYLTLTSSVVTTAIKEASLRAQVQATEEVLVAEERELDLVQRQYKLGAVPKATVLAQSTQVETTRSTLPPLQKQLAQTRHLLSVLVGQLPSEGNVPEVTLAGVALPTQVPVSLPSELVRRRPDIQASEAQLHVASAQVGVATAALYPSIGITAQYGRESLTWQGLFKGQNAIWTIGGGLTQPIFFNGQLTAQRRAAIAAYDSAAEQYRQTVLTAFQGVADALRAIDIDADNLASVARVEVLASDTLKLTEAQYRLGAISALNLLDAQRQYAQAHVNLVQAQAGRLTDTAVLFQAMGGGWWNRTTPLAEVTVPGAQSTSSQSE